MNPATAANDCGRPRIDKRAGRGDRYKTGEHAVAHHRWVGLHSLERHRDISTERAHDTGEHRIDDDID